MSRSDPPNGVASLGALGGALLGLVLGACFDGEASTRGLPCERDSHCAGGLSCVEGFCGGEPRGRDACEDGPICLDAQTLGICDPAGSGGTVARDCTTVCKSEGFQTALGCSTSKGYETPHTCYCDESARSCEAGEESCVYDMREVCVDGVTEVVDCNRFCAESGLVSHGCQQDPEGTTTSCDCADAACINDTSYCADGNTEMRCVLGEWTPIPCSDAACHAEQCPSEYSCPDDYQAHTLGCAFVPSGHGASASPFRCACTE